MFELFMSILPLALASALSPLILAVSVTLLAKKNTKAAAALVLGGLLAAAVVAVAGASVAQEDDKAAVKLGFKPEAADLFFGVIFLAFGLKEFFEKPKEQGLPQGAQKSRGALKWLAISFVGNITNFDAVLLNFAAVRQIFNAAIPLFNQLSLLVFCDFFFLAPALVPLMLYYAAPAKSERALEPVGKWMAKYGHYLVGMIFVAFGLYLVWHWI
jgi:hypothetical protein